MQRSSKLTSPCIHRLQLLFVSMVVLLAFGADVAQGQKKWTGEGKTNNWEDTGNWDPHEIPTESDDVTIPGDAGDIHIKGGHIKVKSLAIGASKKLCGTHLTAAEKGGAVFVRAIGGDVKIGKRSKISARDGNQPNPAATGQNGGWVKVQASGNVINMGKIQGGKGGDGLCPGSGGAVTVWGGEVQNKCGCIEGGQGGSFTGNNPGQNGAGAISGNRGGNVRIHARKGSKTGTVKGGLSGKGFNGSADPKKNGHVFWNSKRIAMAPSDKMRGNKIILESPRPIDLHGLLAGAFVCHEALYVCANGQGIDLTGIPAGTLIFDTPDITFDGSLILDPGVSVNSLCSGNVHLGLCADRWVPYLVLPEDFQTQDAQEAPAGWFAGVQVGTGFKFENTTGISLPSYTGDCGVAIIDAGENGPIPDQATLDTPIFSTVDINGPILLEWDQWHQPSVNSTIEVFVSDGNNLVPVFFNNQGTPANDHPVIDITGIVGNSDDAFVRFQYTAIDQSFWVIDNVNVHVAGPSLKGKAPTMGTALFDINDANNIDGYPVFSQEDGPYFATTSTQSPAHLHFEGPANSVIFLFAGYVMPNATFDPLFGQLDLDAPFVLDAGINNGPFSQQFHIPFQGHQDIFLPFPPQSAGTTMGLQAAYLQMQSGQTEVANCVQLTIED